MAIALRPLVAADGPACDAIMRGLPDFFSYEPGLQDCADAVRTQDGWVAVEGDAVIGFATWQPRMAESAEVTWMAVDRARRGEGVGTKIIEALVTDLRERGYRQVLAMTSGRPKDPAEVDTYDATRAFWSAREFLPLIELDIWETDVALLQVRSLD